MLDSESEAESVSGSVRDDTTKTAAIDRHTPRSVGLDIVRSLAILFVLLSHCGTGFAAWYGVEFPWQLAVAGFFGVELFFVLSGFLIGRLLIDILDRGPSAREWLIFMARRWMRTLPLYFLWLLVLVVIWPPHFWESGSRALWQDLPWFVTLTQNLAWTTVDSWFGVSWSLTVEEWFYLLFSALLFTAVMLAGRRTGFWCTVVLFLVVPAILRWRVPDSVDFNEVLSKVVFYRLDAIAFGVVVAWMCLRSGRVQRYRHALLGFGVLIVVLVWIGELQRLLGLPFHAERTFLFDFTSLGFALCLPAAAAMRWRGQRWLNATARAVSGQSYAIYIIHLSLIEIVSYYRGILHIPTTVAVIGTLAAIYLLSALSYRWFETPILALRPRQASRGQAFATPITTAGLPLQD